MVSSAKQEVRRHFVITEQATSKRARTYFIRIEVEPPKRRGNKSMGERVSTVWTTNVLDAHRFDSEADGNRFLSHYDDGPFFRRAFVREIDSGRRRKA